jgi:hypothetical protein
MVIRPRGLGKITQIKEEVFGMGKLFTYSLELLAAPKGVATQRLVVESPLHSEEIVLAGDATVVVFKAGDEGDQCTLTLDYLDAAGNDSEDFSFEFTIEDKIAPETPAGVGAMTQIAEEAVGEETPVEDEEVPPVED